MAITLVCSCSNRSDPESVLTFLELPAAAHFMTPDGESIIVEPGLYAVLQAGLRGNQTGSRSDG